MITANMMKLAWLDPKDKKIKHVWEARWNSEVLKDKRHNHLTEVKLSKHCTEAIFVYPTYLVTIEDHFEHNYHHFNYIFYPSKATPIELGKDRILKFLAID